MLLERKYTLCLILSERNTYLHRLIIRSDLFRGRRHCCQVTHTIYNAGFSVCTHSQPPIKSRTFSVTNTFLARPHRQACTQARMHAGSLRPSPLKASTCLVLTSFMVISSTVSATKVGCLHESRLAHMNPHLQHPCQASVHCHCLPPSAQSEDVPQSLN